jgi:hypothetical protein
MKNSWIASDSNGPVGIMYCAPAREGSLIHALFSHPPLVMFANSTFFLATHFFPGQAGINKGKHPWTELDSFLGSFLFALANFPKSLKNNMVHGEGIEPPTNSV